MIRPILEEYEWCNFWWDGSQKGTEKRVLLVGDSITNGYHFQVSKNLQMHADTLTTSRALDNPWYLRDLEMILTDLGYEHQVVHLNNGIHGLHLSADDYQAHLEKVILHIKTLTNAAIILCLTTPIVKQHHPELLLDEQNDIILERNNRMKLLAEKYALQIDDLYTPMLGHPEYRPGNEDIYHFNEKGIQAQAELVAQAIRNSGKIGD